MNTHHESGVKFMSPVTLAHLRFPEIHLMYLCMCVCVCVCAFVCGLTRGTLIARVLEQ